MTSAHNLTVLKCSALEEDLALLFQRHSIDMHADTPPESIHMLPREGLTGPDVSFFAIRDAGRPVSMGALKALPPTTSGQREAEIKSMHVLTEDRGRGLSRLMLQALIAEARAQGLHRIYLETGIQPTFDSARALYLKSGFVECSPFQGYENDPNSVFMVLQLQI